MAIGPFLCLDIGDGNTAELFLLRYDADGTLLSPRTERLLKETLEGKTDVFLFSHGWNNDFDTAASRYRTFIMGYLSQNPTPLRRTKPLLIGVIWPSISFLFPWEDGPQIAGDVLGQGVRVEEMRRFVTESLEPEARAELSELVEGTAKVPIAQARQAAEVVHSLLLRQADSDDGSQPPTVDELLARWAALDGGTAAKPSDPDDFGDPSQENEAAELRMAGVIGDLDPRNLLRVATVWKMKGRAGKVGASGVGPLLRHILSRTEARLHLIGHSFGGRLVMSALAIESPVRPARSLLLLQPAVNRWCFAPDVDGSGQAGGYHPVLNWVELPILSTFSAHDVPLRQMFHLAVRGSSLGELRIAAIGDTARYGALGGYGPAGLGGEGSTQTAIAARTGRYDLKTGSRVIAVDASVAINGAPAISGHGDINNPTTWWALHCLTEVP